MNIAVLIKQVPETGNVRMDEASGTMIREGVEAIVNPLDLYAIEAAVQLKEAHGGRVVAITMGPPPCRKALKEAVAMGTDHAVQVTHRAFAGSDTWATSRALAAALHNSGPFDLVLAGERATDGDTGQVGPGVASFLNLPLATYVSRIEVLDGGRLRVHRLVEGGHEVWMLPLPALLTVVKELNRPRLPTLRGKQRAKALEIPVLGPADLGLAEERVGLKASPTRVVKLGRPKVSRQGVRHVVKDEADLDRAVAALVEFLRERRLISS